jgi:hypothetical protein
LFVLLEALLFFQELRCRPRRDGDASGARNPVRGGRLGERIEALGAADTLFGRQIGRDLKTGLAMRADDFTL